MVKLRLARTGSIHNPFYRVVAQDSKCARDGRFIEILGNYDPRNYPASVSLKEERVTDWLSKGAQPTDSVKKLLAVKGLLK